MKTYPLCVVLSPDARLTLNICRGMIGGSHESEMFVEQKRGGVLNVLKKGKEGKRTDFLYMTYVPASSRKFLSHG